MYCEKRRCDSVRTLTILRTKMINTPIPVVYQPDFVARQLECRPDVTKQLEELADRGIILNTWQTQVLLGRADRGVGKTTLGFIRLEETLRSNTTYLRRAVTILPSTDYTVYDPDATSAKRRRDFVIGFKSFLEEHYSDKYSNICIVNDTGLSLDTTEPKVRK